MTPSLPPLFSTYARDQGLLALTKVYCKRPSAIADEDVQYGTRIHPSREATKELVESEADKNASNTREVNLRDIGSVITRLR